MSPWPGIPLSRIFLGARIALLTLGLIGFFWIGTLLVKTLLSPVPNPGSPGLRPFSSAPPQTPSLDTKARRPIEEIVEVFSVPEKIEVALETKGRSFQGGPESSMAVTPSGIGEKLGIKLLGTVSGPKALAHAIIRDETKGQEMPFRVGDTIKGAKIVAIEPLEVIFEYEGRRQALKMGLEYEQSWVFKEDLGTTRPQEDKANPNAFIVSKEEVERALQNPEGLNQQATFLPAFKSGKRNGIIIVKFTQGSILSKLGLKEGDVLQEIDSKPLDLSFRPVALLKEVQQKGEVILSVERRLSPLKLRIRLR